MIFCALCLNSFAEHYHPENQMVIEKFKSALMGSFTNGRVRFYCNKFLQSIATYRNDVYLKRKFYLMTSAKSLSLTFGTLYSK